MAIDGRALRGDATRRIVLDTALVMFAEQGYRATSVRDIAARCGMSHPGVLYHFPSKVDLLMAVLERRDEVDCVEVERIGSASGVGEGGEVGGLDVGGEVGGLEVGGVEVAFADLEGRALLRHLVAGARNNATKRGIVEVFANLSVEASAPDHPAHDYFVGRYASLKSTLVRGFTDLEAAGALRAGVVPAVAAVQVIACMDGLQIQWLLEPDAVDMACALESFFNGMLHEPL